MKKQLRRKITAQTKRNQRRAYKAKKLANKRKYRPVEYIKVWEPGPSDSIIYGGNGKVKKFIKWAGNKKQADYRTREAEIEMDKIRENKMRKKQLILAILKEAGYEPTVHYTKRENRHFTRVVKQGLVKYPKAVDRKFRFTIQRQSEKDPMRNYDFMTDYLVAKDKAEAYSVIAAIAKPWGNDPLFTGIKLEDYLGDDSIEYYTREKLLAA